MVEVLYNCKHICLLLLLLLSKKEKFMLPDISKLKGFHPGVILKKELHLRGIKNNELADLINEHKQTISAIIHERRSINPGISIKLAQYFGVSEDYFMQLQASFDVKRELAKLHVKEIYPSEGKRSKSQFNESDLDKYDWNKNKSAIIQLVLKGANESEINEIKTLFGRQLDFDPYFKEAVQISNIKNLIDGLVVTPIVNTSKLSNHEIKIVQLICQEKTSQEIADILFVQKKTIESARSKILQKIGARNIVGLAIYAIKHQLIEFRL